MQQNDLISRTALMEEIGAIECSQSCDFCVATNCRIGQIVKTAPEVEAAPVAHGRWIEHIEIGAMNNHYECSACNWKTPHFTIAKDSNYCPNCGAKMDGERRSDG